MTTHHERRVDVKAHTQARGVPDWLHDRSRVGRLACSLIAAQINPGDSIDDLTDADVARSVRRALTTVCSIIITRDAEAA